MFLSKLVAAYSIKLYVLSQLCISKRHIVLLFTFTKAAIEWLLTTCFLCLKMSKLSILHVQSNKAGVTETDKILETDTPYNQHHITHKISSNQNRTNCGFHITGSQRLVQKKKKEWVIHTPYPEDPQCVK